MATTPDRTILRLIGAVLVVLVVLPLYALAPAGAPGSPAEYLRGEAAGYYAEFLVGLGGVVVGGLLLGLTPLPRRIPPALGGAKKALLSVRGTPFALAAGGTAALATLLLSAFGFRFHPVLLDAVSQLIHARYLADGHLTGPELAFPEFFSFQFMVNAATGWASQYPPGHMALLALGYLVKAPWLVGPVLAGVAVAATARAAEELLPRDRLAARLGTILLALSLFFLAHAATYMSHVTAAAFGAVAVLGAVRGRGDGMGARAWLGVAGLATGAVLATRPLSGAMMGAVVAAVLFWRGNGESLGPRLRDTVRRLPLVVAGALPGVLVLGWYNHSVFGGVTRFGYLVAEGPGHGLGFHRDPWGRLYTPLDGLAQASTELLALGVELLATPLSAVLVVGAYLLWGPARHAGLSVLLLWALLPLGVHFFYWHHDLVMGPRLLNEYAPAWAILTAVAALGLVRRTRDVRPLLGGRLDLHGALVSMLLLAAVAAAVLMVPLRVATYSTQWGAEARPPVPTVEEPSLVFVHEDWESRLGARLEGHGMRIDSIRLALRHNTSCELQEFLDAREPGRSAGRREFVSPEGRDTDRWEDLHFEPRPGVEIAPVQIAPTVRVRTFAGEEPGEGCIRQIYSDRLGTMALTDLVWRGVLPGLSGSGALFARDLGPELNRRLLDRYPDRTPLVYVRPDPERPPELVPYAEGMELLWRMPEDRIERGGSSGDRLHEIEGATRLIASPAGS